VSVNPITGIATLNSIQASLTLPPTALFITQNIDDPVVQQNFELLNKILAQKTQGNSISPANIVFGAASGSASASTISGTAQQVLTAVQVQIATRGNPVRVKVAPFSYNSTYPSYLKLSTTATNIAQATFGWLRIGSSGGTPTVISSVTVGAGIAANSINFAMPLPAFEFDDCVATGTYTYQFFVKLLNSSQTLTFQNINAVAYELR
jgi:hypothetical protein